MVLLLQFHCFTELVKPIIVSNSLFNWVNREANSVTYSQTQTLFKMPDFEMYFLFLVNYTFQLAKKESIKWSWVANEKKKKKKTKPHMIF